MRKDFEKKLKAGKIMLVFGILFLLSAIGIASIIYIDATNEMAKEITLIDAKEKDYAYVDAELMTDYFAIDDSTSLERKSYFVWDKNYIYIVALNQENRDLLNPIYKYSYKETETKPDAIRIKGTVKLIPDDLRRIAMDSYNSMYEEKFLNTSNFENYLGKYYLDTFETPKTEMISNLAFALPSILLAILFFAIYFSRKNTTSKCIKKLEDKWEKVLEEIDNENTIYYNKAKLYLTRNYLISHLNGLEVYNYKDIVWIYPHEYRYNGRVSQKSIFVVTKDSKAHKLATLNASKKNLNLHDEIYNTMLNKLPKALSGYNNENKEKAKEMYQK